MEATGAAEEAEAKDPYASTGSTRSTGFGSGDAVTATSGASARGGRAWEAWARAERRGASARGVDTGRRARSAGSATWRSDDDEAWSDDARRASVEADAEV